MGTLNLVIGADQMVSPPAPGFTEIYEKYSSTVFKTALRVTGNPADAEDVLQTVFLRIFNQLQADSERAATLEEMKAAERYYKRAATNASLDIIRRKLSKNETQLDSSNFRAPQESSAFLKERLRRALGPLDPRDAEMFTLRYVEGLSNGEIAQLYGVLKARVAMRLYKIRLSLQAEMER